MDPDGNEFPKLHNDRIVKAAFGHEVDRVPVWIMRQAGRYLPEFREFRKQHAFFDVCQTPELACEVTLMPLQRFDLDAAIIFSDILIIPQALGQEVVMAAQGPHFPHPLERDGSSGPWRERLNLDVDIAERLSYVYEAIRITRHKLNGRCPLIGFSGAPWTLMCYMVEGGGSKTMSKAKRWLYEDPQDAHELLSMLASKVTDHLVEQARHGAQLVQLFESNAGFLDFGMFSKFAYPYIKEICRNFKKRTQELKLEPIPVIVFAKDAHYALELMSGDSDIIDVISIDWTIDASVARSKTARMTLQGNLDPCALYASDKELVGMTTEMVTKFGSRGYIANLGHGIYPDADPDKVKLFIDTVHACAVDKKQS